MGKELITKEGHLPATTEELQKFVQIGEAQVRALQLGLEAIQNIGDASQYYSERLEHGQQIAEIVLNAHVKLGEMLGKIIPQSSQQGRLRTLPDGITHKQSHYAQRLFKNPSIIEEVKDDCIEQGRLVTASEVIRKISGWYQTSDSYEWETPQWLFDVLDKEFHFTLDVCASKTNRKCKNYYSKEDNGLTKDWEGVCWMNPPYGKEIADWMMKAKGELALVVCLVPARPDTEWWWDNCIQGEIRFIKGRLQWPGSNTAAPFPSAVVILGSAITPKVVWWDVQNR